MKLQTERLVAAPAAAVFAVASDFGRIAQEAAANDMRVTRIDTAPGVGIGMCWQVDFSFQGQARSATATVTDFDPPEGFALRLEGRSIRVGMELHCQPRDAGSTLLRVRVEAAPRGLKGRLLLQSARLMQARLDAGLARVAERIAEGAEAAATR